MAKLPNDFKKVKALWYKKLRDSGFEDAESDEFNLKVWSLKFTTPKTVRDWQAKTEYYYMANHFLNNYKFEAPLDKVIWEYHTNGISVREIAKLLKKVKIKADRNSVWLIVKKLKSAMKLAIYE